MRRVPALLTSLAVCLTTSERVYDNYNDRSTFFTIGENLPVATALEDNETFDWQS